MAAASLELDIKSITDEELRIELRALQEEHLSLAIEHERAEEEIESLRDEAFRLQQSAEIEEENVANTLLRRLQGAEQERLRLKRLLTSEEDVRSTTVRQIAEVRRQQTEIENQLEQEQEYLMLQLQKKLVEVAGRKSQLEKELVQEHLRYLDLLNEQLGVLKANSVSLGSSTCVSPTASPAPPPVEDCAILRLPTSSTDVPMGSAVRENVVSVGASAPPVSSTPFVPQGLSSTPCRRCSQSGGVARAHADPTVQVLLAATPTEETISAANKGIGTGTHHPERAMVIALEKKLNAQLAKHMEAMQMERETTALCMELSKKLEELQQSTFLDRARAAKLKEDLEQMRHRLPISASGDLVVHGGLCRTPSQVTPEDIVGSSLLNSTTPLREEDMNLFSRSLRDHTRDVLTMAVEDTFSPFCTTHPHTHNRMCSEVSETYPIIVPIPLGFHSTPVEGAEGPRLRSGADGM